MKPHKCSYLGLIRFLAITSGLVAALCLTALPARAQTLTTLVNFDWTTGEFPSGFPLVQGRDGSLYGTADIFGAAGTIFKVSPQGTLTTVHNIYCEEENCHGINPQTLVLNTDGNFYGTNWGTYDMDLSGTIFEMTPSGALTTKATFCNHGWYCDEPTPTSPLTLATNGIFYGTSWLGGQTDAGTVFRFKPGVNGHVSVVNSFCTQPSCVDGSFTISGVIQATDGNFYGTTDYGGNPDCSVHATGCGTVFKITPGGLLTTVYSFGTQPNDGASPSGVIQGRDGNFYGVTADRGAYGNGTIFKLTPTGILTTLWNFTGADGGSPRSSLIQTVDGNLYGTASTGGMYGGGTIFELTSTNNLTTLHDFAGTDGNFPLGLMQNTNGIFYGTTGQGGTGAGCGAGGCGTVFSLDFGLAPFVSLLPTSGAVAQTVGILGQGLTSTSSVTFGSASAAFTVVSDTFITASVPAEGTSDYVRVNTGSGTLTSNKRFGVLPIITGFSPSSGPVGTQVVITGGGFRKTTKISIGGVLAGFTLNSGSQITAIVPAKAKTGIIRVVTADSTAKSSGIFTVL